ncbi:MAG: VOC family protein [Gemmatimonadetes bacterium]|nr:VOC family protein [Gemmatimonadota bacterium]
MRLEKGESSGPSPGVPLTRRELVLGLLAAAAARPRPLGAGIPGDVGPAQSVLPFRVLTLNHISFVCDDLASTVAWFERVLGIPRHAFQDYLGGGQGQTVLRSSVDPPAYMALSQRPREAIGTPRGGRPHFCWGIEDFNVHRILAGLAEMKIPAESVLREGTTINGVNFDGPDGEPFQFNPVIACGGVGFLGEVCDGSARAVQRPGDPPPVQVATMNHIKYYHADLDRALEWYLRLTDMRVVTYQERQGGPRTEGYSGRPLPVLRIGSGPQHLVLAEGSGAEASRMHVGFGVAGFDADRVMARLAEHGVSARVRMREGVTPEVLVDGPDNVRIQIQDVSYCGGTGRLGNVCTQ